MTWTPLTDYDAALLQHLERWIPFERRKHRDQAWLPSRIACLRSALVECLRPSKNPPGDPWSVALRFPRNPLRDAKLLRHFLRWINIVRKEDNRPTWLPKFADYYKSALFERLRSGKEPLPYPPPVALTCPWYAVVEDLNPHVINTKYSGDHVGPHFHKDGIGVETPGQIWIFENGFELVETGPSPDGPMIVRDGGRHRGSPYRYRLWWDPEYVAHVTNPVKGAWLLQRVPELEAGRRQVQ